MALRASTPAPTELVQRVAALKKQTEMLQKADKFARAEFSRRPGAVATSPAVVPEAADASVVVALEELSLEQLRSLVRVLVDENKLWQHVEHASRTALQALDTPASNTSAADGVRGTTSSMAVRTPRTQRCRAAWGVRGAASRWARTAAVHER